MPGRGCNLAMLKWVKRNHELSGTCPPGGEKSRCEGSKVEASLVFSSQRLTYVPDITFSEDNKDFWLF